MENSTEFYYEKLKTNDNPGAILASFYGSLYEVTVTKSEIIMCNKLIKVFGRFTVFFSILDMAGSYPDVVEKPYPLLYTICKRKFEAAHSNVLLQSREPLDNFVNNINKELEKLKKHKIKIPSTEGLE